MDTAAAPTGVHTLLATVGVSVLREHLKCKRL
jgi:hypothetical protein